MPNSRFFKGFWTQDNLCTIKQYTVSNSLWPSIKWKGEAFTCNTSSKVSVCVRTKLGMYVQFQKMKSVAQRIWAGPCAIDYRSRIRYNAKNSSTSISGKWVCSTQVQLDPMTRLSMVEKLDVFMVQKTYARYRKSRKSLNMEHWTLRLDHELNQTDLLVDLFKHFGSFPIGERGILKFGALKMASWT